MCPCPEPVIFFRLYFLCRNLPNFQPLCFSEETWEELPQEIYTPVLFWYKMTSWIFLGFSSENLEFRDENLNWSNLNLAFKILTRTFMILTALQDTLSSAHIFSHLISESFPKMRNALQPGNLYLCLRIGLKGLS